MPVNHAGSPEARQVLASFAVAPSTRLGRRKRPPPAGARSEPQANEARAKRGIEKLIQRPWRAPPAPAPPNAAAASAPPARAQ